ncbi:G-protein coupled receptor family C group 6 member A-like isoform X1 [Labrus bergylta]|uniref:G-protein coupled receptor family C group 6 member A-like isoform X1 n=1 Tax=Labrus bergylta TaxID=56723 RepID=UPI00331336B3
MKQFSGFYIFASVLLNQLCITTGSDAATAPGDIIIGGLFPIHESIDGPIYRVGSDEGTCGRFHLPRLVQSLMMVHAVEEVNRRGELGNLTLGYRIVDSCSDVTTSLRNTLSFMKLNNTFIGGAEQPSPPVLAAVGAYYSEISIAVTRQLNLENIPLISYGSTCGQLSDKTRFPSFMRTVPEDDHQIRAIIHILKSHNWTWVGLVATDSEAGRYAVERLQKHAKNNKICFAFTSILPEALVDDSLDDCINETVKSITEKKHVKVIVSFAKAYHMMYLFGRLLKDPRGRGKVWVASDNWSESAEVLANHTLSDVGKVFGLTLKSGNTARFRQYLTNLDVNPGHHHNNTFLYKYLMRRMERKPNDTANKELMRMIYPSLVNVEMAVRAIAQAVADLCVNRDCRTTQRLLPLELRKALRKATFQMDGKSYRFDSRGDLNTGYDVVLWKQTSLTFLDTNYMVAHYHIQNKNLTFIPGKTLQDFKSVTTDVISRCSNSCSPGYMKYSAPEQPDCCYECHKCPMEYYSNTTDSSKCHPCNITTEYVSSIPDSCLQKKTVFMFWGDIYHEILLAFAALGVVLTFIVGIIFLAHWNTPVVRSSVGPICLLLLFSLISTFVSVPLFGGEPKPWQCQARQVFFGLSFTLSVSCVMVKSFKIIMAFEFDPSIQRVLKKLYQPYIIIAFCLLGQVIICALWLALKSPKPNWKKSLNNKERLFICNETSFVAFGAMLSYIGLLALICFGIAFKGRKLPQSYNDAKFITFSMLIYFICWIIFGPVYLNVTGKYLPAVEMVVILLSAYGILFCQFITKCYIILFKQKANTQSAFRRDVRNFTSGGNIDENDGHFVSSSLDLEGIENPALYVEAQM